MPRLESLDSLDISEHSATASSRAASRTVSSDESPKKQESVMPEIAVREQRAVIIAKVLVLVVLLAAVGAVGAGTYLFMDKQEQTDFENEFLARASELTTLAQQRADRLFDTIENLSIIAMAAASSNPNSTWPFTIVPDWSTKATNIQKLLGVSGSVVSIIHIVERNQLDEFTNFMAVEAPKLFVDAVSQGKSKNTVEELLSNTVPFPWQVQADFSVTPSSSLNVTSMIAAEVFPLEISPLGITYVNIDVEGLSETQNLFKIVNATRKPGLSFFQTVDPVEKKLSIESQIMFPIYESNHPDASAGDIVGLSFLMLRWKNFVESLLINDYSNMYIEIESDCAGGLSADVLVVSFYINDDGKAETVDRVGLSDTRYDDLRQTKDLVDLAIDPSTVPDGLCVPKVILSIYPHEKFEESFRTSDPLFITSMVILIFAFTIFVFLVYDYFVRRRGQIYMKKIKEQEAIVSDIFPTTIRDRMLGLGSQGKAGDSLPLADLFVNTTVIVANIVGFTAWSSAREPEQVFILLEKIYSSFDKLANRYSVFKVETVGDSYIAVVGLPEPNEEHYYVACRFAQSCIRRMKELTEKLEVTLGPDTADLALRVGIHSGQVTAGVLRGERSRFQLFGDCVNTASRMESTGKHGCVHLSEATANLLIQKGLSSIVEAREEKLFIKGKGEMQTYWFQWGGKKSDDSKFLSKDDKVVPTSDGVTEAVSVSDEMSTESDGSFAVEAGIGLTKTERLVEWNVEVLSSLLQHIIASRDGKVEDISHLAEIEHKLGVGRKTVLDEFKPIIPLKRFDADDLKNRCSPSSIIIGDEAKAQLRLFLKSVANLYQDNPFHNFEHASHVTASVKKLLRRIVTLDESSGMKMSENRDVKLEDIAGHSYGITSDPLTQFAVVFSAVIHDVDHPGVPNTQLLKEETPNAKIYGKSIAEQNSVYLTWELFMSDEFKSFRACIYQTEEEFRRFRQLVVNTVMATDIADKELGALRKARWETAFSESPLMESLEESEDRKATIVIEHLIQASDVSHTMQHWHIYKKWNEKFFMECYGAYRNGRAETDPSLGWYTGEIGFFNFYVIPLAKKLDSCGVFGVSSHEYLSYATANRDEWIREGESIVKEFLAKYEREYEN